MVRKIKCNVKLILIGCGFSDHVKAFSTFSTSILNIFLTTYKWVCIYENIYCLYILGMLSLAMGMIIFGGSCHKTLEDLWF